MKNLLKPSGNVSDGIAKFKAQKEATRTQKLKERYTEKGWVSRYKWAYNILSVFAFFILTFSVISATFGVYTLVSFIIPIPAIALIASLVATSIIAYIQLKSSHQLWDTFFSKDKIDYTWLTVNIIIVCLSMAGSGFGLYQATLTADTGAEIIEHDETLAYYQDQLANVNAGIEASKKTTWKGKITRKSQSAIKEYTKSQNALVQNIAGRMSKVDSTNEDIKAQHKVSLWHIFLSVLLIYLILEISFESSMCFTRYYDRIDYLERTKNTITEGPTFSKVGELNNNENLLNNVAPPSYNTKALRPIGFQPMPSKPLASNTSEQVVQKTKTTAPKQAKTTVEQTVQPNLNNSKTALVTANAIKPVQPIQAVQVEKPKQAVQSVQSTVQAVQTNTETIIIVDSNEASLRSRCKLAYKRMHTQKDPATPTKNYQKFKGMLEALGYEVTPTTHPDGSPNLIYNKG